MKVISRSVYLLVGALLLETLSGACKGKPESYEECVLRGLEGSGKSDAVAVLVKQACRDMFSDISTQEEDVVVLDSMEVAALGGRGGPSYSNLFAGTLYNGNSHVTVTEVTLVIETIEDGRQIRRPYRVQLNVPPQTSKSYSFTFVQGDKDEKFTWSIGSAKGKRSDASDPGPAAKSRETLKRLREEVEKEKAEQGGK